MTWSIQVRDIESGQVLLDHEPERVLRTASVGKLFVLIELAARLEGGLDPATKLDRRRSPAVDDSGLIQSVDGDLHRVDDLATLVGAVSDNWATNMLVDALGLDAIRDRAGSLTDPRTTIHDYVRRVRDDGMPPTLSTGCAGDWTALLRDLHRGSCVSAAADARVRDWLREDTDTSMVAAAFGLDPLAHREPDGGLTLWHKTGTDAGVRADIGVLEGPARAVAYAVLAGWEDGGALGPRRQVLQAMHAIGEQLVIAAG